MVTKVIITVEVINAAFEDPGELARIVRVAADRLDASGWPVVVAASTLLDIDGNVVGSITTVEEE